MQILPSSSPDQREKSMPKPLYEEHQIHEVAGFRIVDATSAGPRPHDDLIWIGVGDGIEGKWIAPESAMALVAAIAQTAHGNMERRRMAELADGKPIEQNPLTAKAVPVLEPLEPLPLDGFPITKLTLLNPVAKFVTDPVFTMKWLQTVAQINLEPELVQVATDMALELAAKGEKLSLMSVIELWRPVPELRDFAETLYFLGGPGPFGPYRSKAARTN
jgi:hypothetical protein